MDSPSTDPSVPLREGLLLIRQTNRMSHLYLHYSHTSIIIKIRYIHKHIHTRTSVKHTNMHYATVGPCNLRPGDRLYIQVTGFFSVLQGHCISRHCSNAPYQCWSSEVWECSVLSVVLHLLNCLTRCSAVSRISQTGGANLKRGYQLKMIEIGPRGVHSVPQIRQCIQSHKFVPTVYLLTNGRIDTSHYQHVCL